MAKRLTEFDLKKYTIYKGTRNTDSFNPLFTYQNKKSFINKINQLGYKPKAKISDKEFFKKFGDYSIMILY